MTKIQQSLFSQFEQHRFVFWHDIEANFASELTGLGDITIVQLDSTPALAVKLDIERAPADSKWLFYSQQAQPAPEDDWLLDVRMRAKPFHADEASIQLEDLGLHTVSVRAHLKERSAFLRAKERFEKLKRLTLSTDQAADLDRKMIAVLIRAEQADLFSMLTKLFTAMDAEGEVNLAVEPKGWAELLTYGLRAAFWDLVEAELGYRDTNPSLRDLLFHLMVTDLAQGLVGDLPSQLSHFQIHDRAKAASASVFLSQWRGSITHYGSYDAVSAAVAEALQLTTIIATLPAEKMLDAMTFAEVEKWIIKDLRDRILSSAVASADAVHAIFERRRDGHWANPKLAATSDVTRALLNCYEALEAAADFLCLCEQYKAGFSFDSAMSGIEAYQKTLYHFDQHYRHFHRAAEQVDMMGWQLLQLLRERVEEAYTGWFVPQLGIAWSKLLEGDSGLLKNWSVPGVINQQDFYRREVKATLDNTSVKRIFVIISDAFRYEAAEELSRQILTRNKYKTELRAMLGVLPSYTSLGMAALLPHDTLSYKVGANISVLVDGKSTASLEDRNAILAKHGGIAINWEELVSLGKDKARDRVRDASVVYIYHDQIDMLGDKAASENKTFEAVENTLEELNRLVGFVVGNLAASTVLVTADHGFLYQESPLDNADRSTLNIKAIGALKAKKRYVLGNDLGQTDKAWFGSTEQTAGTEADASLHFWVPKGATRFHFSGGAKFVHGSAMPQEIVVPLLTIKLSETDKAKVEHVGIAPMLLSNKIVSNISRFEFVQTAPVSAKVLPRTVNISVRDGDTVISNEQVVTFDSSYR
ncbi:BREX-1 system phosphatase PglZ type A [Chitinibacter sp. FCG-7]|uniref:BREX-1 system phosphatase PglZ type A n=1 Tax=Chitinibacter mangrovi TaxID=3153927 RepID=A0AAU7F8H3_9NEIS